MRSAIDDKMYELIIKPENFKFAYDINERFDSIKERVIQEFWELLILRLKKEFPEFSFKYKQGYNQYLEISDTSFRDFTPFVEIAQEQFHYGVSFYYNGTQKKMRELEREFGSLFLENDYNLKGKIAWFFNYSNEHFDTLSGLNKILPENKDLLIDQYIREFKTMVQSIEKTIAERE